MDIKCPLYWICLVFFINVSFTVNLEPRQSCSAGYSLCSPPGAVGISTYDAGNSLLDLYSNLLDTVNPQTPAAGAPPQPTDSNGPARRASSDTMCCAAGLSCLLLQTYQIPMCYDKFTTDFALPNGDYGTVSNGSLVTMSGYRINLINGDYTMPSGLTGNIYSNAGSNKPDTATLPIPTQFTNSGVGSVVPASQLGNTASYFNPPTTITAVNSPALSTSSMFNLSLSGPPVAPCSTCCIACGSSSSTGNITISVMVPPLSTQDLSTSSVLATSTTDASTAVSTTASTGNEGSADFGHKHIVVTVVAVISMAHMILT